MIKNYLKIAWRNVRKQLFYSSLNIFGLSLGLASCLLITLYLVEELSYDHFFENSERIYRVDADIKFGGPEMKLAVSSDPMAFTLKKDYPQVEAATRIRENGSYLVRKSEATENLTEALVVFADSTFFDVFSIPMVSGNPAKALTEPNTLVLSERNAEKYFGKENPVGQTLLLDNDKIYRVTGVMQNIPANSHLSSLNMLLSMASREESRSNNWGGHNFNTYIRLSPETDAQQFDKNFDTILDNYVGPYVKGAMGGTTLEDLEKAGNFLKYHLIPLTKIHLHSDRVAELSVNGNIQYVYIFSIVAIFLLLIACINFMNLATARSASRAREVGVRKVLGSKRSALVAQFLTESLLLSYLSLVLALLAAFALMPLFNQLAGKDITLPVQNPGFWLLLLLTGGIVGILAGSYPAFFLSGFQAIKVLKGRLVLEGKGGFLRNSLVVFQFVISVMLIVGTLIIYRQLNFIQAKSLGYSKDQVVLIENAYALGTQTEVFKQEILSQGYAESATMSDYLPTPSSRSDNMIFPEGQPIQDKGMSMQNWRVDEDYAKTLGIQVVEGRFFSKEFPSDSSAIVLNEEAVRMFGFDDPIGKKLVTNTGPQDSSQPAYTVIGVVKDFHFESLHSPIGPLNMILGNSPGKFAFRLNASESGATIKKAEALWKRMAPGQPFEYRFMDQDFDKTYRAEQRIGRIFITFALLSILIACLGLFGLAAFTAEHRTKEIGVRKVLGASVATIVAMLSGDFLKLILIAILIATPISWYIMDQWLQDFAYKITIQWWMFLLAGMLSILISLLTVSYQSIKAALMNPVKSLRSE
ncbi:ABC transporter permease [Arundinibacter roseus]|uniref:ABC transporter permease n=1 Tax=Arundinibacter roseus TaxID=2070510 RepID=A0A4R4KH71_9BACT|nr:ABC transporter permease [Arundinibacter roseus]TDB65919.1 ABC transporter permease [Arundinibacter roseus]